MSPSANEGDDDMHERRHLLRSSALELREAEACLREGTWAGGEIPRLASW